MENNSSLLINGISTGLFDQNQVQLRADAGDEGFVILDSAISLTQGLWPPTSDYNTTLANGTTIVAPLSGYQYTPGTFLSQTSQDMIKTLQLCLQLQVLSSTRMFLSRGGQTAK